MKCPNPNCDAIMLINWYKDYDDRYIFQQTCTVCRVIQTRMELKDWKKVKVGLG